MEVSVSSSDCGIHRNSSERQADVKKEQMKAATWAITCIILVFLWVSGKAALKAVLPELREPWVAGVGAEPELQEVIIEGGDLFGLQLDGDAPHGLLLVPLHHLHPVCPAVATRENNKQWSKWSFYFLVACLGFCFHSLLTALQMEWWCFRYFSPKSSWSVREAFKCKWDESP